MSNSVTQSPLGVNVLGSLLSNVGLNVNPTFASYTGSSGGYATGAGYTNGGPYTPGSVVGNTVLRLLTYSINRGYIGATSTGTLSNTTYNNLISIGNASVPALGNSKPPTFTQSESSGATGVGDTWAPTGWGGPDQYTRTVSTDPPNPVTAWGFLRTLALQSQNEWNYNNSQPTYGDFLSSYDTADGFIDSTNKTIKASNNSLTYLDGAYSNMNDLMTGDIAGISLSTLLWGQDLIRLGNALDLSTLNTFGMPSNLLHTLRNNNALTGSLVVALIASGISNVDIESILNGELTPTENMERNMYAAYTVITDQDLEDILVPLNCKTSGLSSLADLLNPAKLFPTSYTTLTVPLYNVERGPTNSKTYYPIYNSTGGINATLYSPTITAKIAPEPIGRQPEASVDQVSTSDINDALQILQNSTDPNIRTRDTMPIVTPYNPITTAGQSITTSVVAVMPQIQREPSAASIASGAASSPQRDSSRDI